MITPKEVYAKLFRVLCKMKKLHYAEWNDFMAVSEIIQYKANEHIIEAGTPSTHSYFIISGLIMCYEGTDPKNIKWFRAEDGYAFANDMLIPFKHQLNNQTLVALEDTVVVRISHEDFKWLCDTHMQMFVFSAGYLHYYGRIMSYMFSCFAFEPRERYQYIQRLHGFKLSRIPDVYLTKFTGIPLKRLKTLHKDTYPDFLTRY